MKRTSRRLWLTQIGVVAALVGFNSGGCTCGRQQDLVAQWRGGQLERDAYDAWRTYHHREPSDEAVRDLIFTRTLAAANEAREVSQQRTTQLELLNMQHRLIMKFLQARAIADVDVSDAEIDAALSELPEPQAQLLLFNIHKRIDKGNVSAVRSAMRAIHAKLDAGADFAELARNESESETRFRDGRVGYTTIDRLPPSVAAAVRDLAPGEFSAPVEHDGGISIFLCEKAREAHVAPLEKRRAAIRERLLTQRRAARREQLDGELVTAADAQIDPAAHTVVFAEHGENLSAADVQILETLSPEPRPTDATDEASRLARLMRGWVIAEAGRHRVEAEGLNSQTPLVDALRWERLELLAHREFVRRVDARVLEPTEAELITELETHPRRYLVPEAYDLSVIELDASDPKRSFEIEKDLERGKLSFEQAARQFSRDTSSSRGGHLGWMTKREVKRWGPQAVHAVQQLEPGHQTGPLRLTSGVWIFRVDDRRPAAPGTLETVRSEVTATLRRAQIPGLEQAVRHDVLEPLAIQTF